ncbi:biopolymer transporter ExbD [Roseibacterium beibuensis]|uniref:Biopolymer transport protein ExbD n=1 Tax=[Roseibacterium] beibuensis TaxID=1193142 RepID=A0ABP9L2F7_9RHOB|nr:biopolymer transporter ExbD [Roseibacterium beibuensis]MCS6621692.1 biopolymer transporter ExbD [Roseibacterium beibuensis]
MALAPSRKRRRPEPMIALINVVFLMLVFFLVAASIAPPMERGVTLVRADRLEGRAPPDAAVIRADGTMVYRGAEITSEAYLTERLSERGAEVALRLVPDRALPAQDLVAIARELRAAGAAEIWIVTERGLP